MQLEQYDRGGCTQGLRVLKAGLATTVQDLGRTGLRAFGVPSGGAADAVALRVANLLVGNPEGEAGLELTLAGPTLEFCCESVIALCGAPFEAWLDGEPLEPMRPYYVPRGGVLAVRRSAEGCRAMLAVAGGIAVPAVLGSRSTYARGGLGGAAGRPLAADDLLPLGALPQASQRLMERLRGLCSHGGSARAPFRAAAQLCPPVPQPGGGLGQPVELRALPGREAERFTPEAAARFWNGTYTVRPEADRMGARLSGAPLALAAPHAMVSEAVAPGAVQVPPDGQPIVLLPDCGTTGGYPRIAHVAAADLPLLAQLAPGASLRFRRVSLFEAEQLVLERERQLACLKIGLQRWLSS